MESFQALLDKYGGFRKKTWRLAADTIIRQGAKRLVETGCFRGTDADGYSTILLAALAREVGGHLDSYELEPRNIECSRRKLAVMGLAQFVTLVQGDSITNLALRGATVDFAYLDSFDCGTGPLYDPCQRHQLAECEAIFPLLNKKASILLDDYIPETGGKPKLAMKRLENRGFKNLATDYQVLFACDDTTARLPNPFAVITGHLPGYVPLAVRTIYKNKAQYCLRHGYELHVLRGVRPEYKVPGTHADGYSWSRLADMLDLINSGLYGWVWCVGADTLVTNMKIPLSELTNTDAHVIIAGECVAPIQADSFLVRSSEQGAGFLKLILDSRKKYERHPWVENMAMIDLRHKYSAITKIVPQWKLNSYDYTNFYETNPVYRSGLDYYGYRGQWHLADFLIHWAGINMQKRQELLDKHEPQIIE